MLLPNNLVDEDDVDPDDPSVLRESIFTSRIEDLLAHMRFHEVPKRAQFSIPFELAKGLTLGVKGFVENRFTVYACLTPADMGS